MYYYWKEAKNRFCIAMYINNILPMGMISNSFSHQYVYNHILYKMPATMNN